jgi:hypothetical protein
VDDGVELDVHAGEGAQAEEALAVVGPGSPCVSASVRAAWALTKRSLSVRGSDVTRPAS